jgi:hypothetical protein
MNAREENYFRDRAAREIAIAHATGAKAFASADNRKIFILRPDGTSEALPLPRPTSSRATPANAASPAAKPTRRRSQSRPV